MLIYKNLQERIEIYDRQTEYEEYQKFWRELKNKNDHQIQILTRFMISKCNR